MAEDDFHKRYTQPGVPKDIQPFAAADIPKMIGPYKIGHLLEKGGMSILYLGTHPNTKELTTIKVLSPKYLSHPDVIQRFLNEAEIIAMTNHPNIIKLYGHGEWEGGLYIAMEFIQGISLRQLLLSSPISLKRALEIVIDIAYALCHLHTHGVIHRDLKPENILITESNEVKVIDFGIAQILTDQSDAEASSRRLIGTPIYMSPEQRKNPESVSYPSDIYSLGIITYELVMGKLSQGQVHLALAPKGLQRILNKALQPKPEDRYQDVVDFITDISAYLNSTNMQKEKKVGDHLSELSENLRNAQTLLAPMKTPDWQGIEIGSANHKGADTYAVYYDFLVHPNGTFGILMGESSAKGAEGLIYTAMLRGMVRTLMRMTTSPIDMVATLNRHIIEDNIDQIFTLSYLSLLPEENKLNYISCGYGNLWRIPEKTGVPSKITANNIALGIDRDTEFMEIIAPWEPGDLLLLSSYGISTADSTENSPLLEEAIQRELQENANTPPQRIVDSILRKFKATASRSLRERTQALISIRRKAVDARSCE